MKISVTRLETQMDRVIEDVSKNTREIAQHSDDLLAHDMELEQALDQLKLKRARRQPLRGWDIK